MSSGPDKSWTSGTQAGGLITALLVSSAAAWLGVLATRTPLVSARPEAPELPAPLSFGPQRVPARLWQDPIDALYALPAEEWGRRKQCLSAVRNQVTEAARSPDPVLLLPVFVSSQAYPETFEARLRTRYAVLAALGAAGYVPEDRWHIGFFIANEPNCPNCSPPTQTRSKSEIDPDSVRTDAPARPSPRSVPFEWFRPAQRKIELRNCAGTLATSPTQTIQSLAKILVLWIIEDELGSAPLNALVELTEELRRGAPKSIVRCLGPTNSDVLAAIFTDAEAIDFRQPRDFMLYSPWATSRQRGDHDSNLPQWFVRTIATDDKTCASLADELRLRSALPGSASDARGEYRNYVALVSEGDTLYGQALPDSFVTAAARDPNDPDRPPTEAERRFVKSYVRCYAYLRGVDGLTPGPARDGGAASKGGNAPSAPRGEPRAAGGAQLDYLRRLEQQLREFDRAVRNGADGKKGRLRAVGVLGSDVYDKLLILRALKAGLPGVIFFTTDLDARLMHPSELQYTRNLVVAAPFGLQLREDLQAGIVPFRDSYQTSVFYAALRALADPDNRATPSPLRFEIGLSGAYDLGLTENASPHLPGPRSQPRFTLSGSVILILGVALLALLLISLVPWYQQLANGLLKFHWRPWLAVLVGATPLAVLAWTARSADGQSDEEPFQLFNGISAWPTEFLRVGACLVSVGGCVWIVRRTAASLESLSRAYFLSLTDQLARRAARRRLPQAWGEWCRAAGVRLWRGIVTRARARRWAYVRSLERLRQRSGTCRAPSAGTGRPTKVRAAWRMLGDVLVAWLLVTPRVRRPSRTGPPSSADTGCLTKMRAAWCVLGDMLAGWLPFAPPHHDSDRVDALWRELRERRARRWTRVMSGVILLSAAFVALFVSLGGPLRPVRGVQSRLVDVICVLTSVVTLLILLILVIDVTRLCDWFARHLLRPEPPRSWRWEKLVEAAQQRGLFPWDMNEWLSIRLMAEYTSSVDWFIYLPFTALLIIAVSRHPVFDAWDWPPALVGALLAIFVGVTYAAVVLRMSAKRARSRIVRALREKTAIVAAQQPGENERAKRLQQLADDIAAERRGAFSPLQEDPVLRAVLIPSSGMGALAVIDFLTKLV